LAQLGLSAFWQELDNQAEFAFAYCRLDRTHHSWSAVDHDPLADFERNLAM
jgi:hypothetical protein